MFCGNDIFFKMHCTACRILVPHPGLEPVLPAMGGQSLSHWTLREILIFLKLHWSSVFTAVPLPSFDFFRMGMLRSVTGEVLRLPLVFRTEDGGKVGVSWGYRAGLPRQRAQALTNWGAPGDKEEAGCLRGWRPRVTLHRHRTQVAPPTQGPSRISGPKQWGATECLPMSHL